MDGNTPLFDLSQLSFDEFVTLFFDHNIETDEYWYHDPDLSSWNDFNDAGVATPAIVVGHMTRLFTEFSIVASKFSLPQINAGIWGMLTEGGPFRLQKHLWLPSVPLSQRLACVRSMYFVYSDFVAKSTVQVMESCFDVWWDVVASNFWEHLQFTQESGEGNVSRLNADQRALLDAMFETLSKILALPDSRTQSFALHGLGHLHHPSVRDEVQRFLDKNRAELTREGIKWVEQCRDGTVM